MGKLSDIKFDELKKKDKVLFVRIIPPLGYYEIHDTIVITKKDDYCTVSDKRTKQSFLLDKKYAEEVLFNDRKKALSYLNEQKEKNKDTKVYEE